MGRTTELKIRQRERSGYVREAEGYQVWTEYQVIQGRKIIGRFEIESQAEKFVREWKAPEGQP